MGTVWCIVCNNFSAIDETMKIICILIEVVMFVYVVIVVYVDLIVTFI